MKSRSRRNMKRRRRKKKRARNEKRGRENRPITVACHKNKTN